MSTAKCFADTNVAIYAVDADVAKREKALAVLAACRTDANELAMNIGERYQINQVIHVADG